MRFWRWRPVGLWLWALVAVIGLAPKTARAALYVTWDLDSLVENSQVIVEGQIDGMNQRDWIVRVLHVYRGEVADQQPLMVAASYYRKSFNMFDPQGEEAGRLAKGDRLFCFLRWDGHGGQARRRTDDSTVWEPVSREAMHWEPLPGGVKLVAAGKVVDFSQRFNPRPVVAELGPKFARRFQFAVEDFKKLLEDQLHRVERLRSEIKQELAAKDGTKLVELLREQVARKNELVPAGDDVIVKAAVAALIELHDYAALGDAIIIGLGYELDRGFLTEAGREFLLQTIGDPKVDLAKRIRCVKALPYHGKIMGSDGHYRRDPHYLARLAKLAAENPAVPQLCAELAGHVGGFGGIGPVLNPSFLQEPVLLKDLNEAMDTLVTLYREKADEPLRFCIEKALRSNSLEAYQRLKPKGGPVISMVRPQQPGQFGKPSGRSFSVELEYNLYFADDATRTLQVQAILNVDGKSYDGGTGMPLTAQRHGSGSSTRTVRVSSDAPAGKYRLYFRFSENGKVLGQSHYLEVEI